MKSSSIVNLSLFCASLILSSCYVAPSVYKLSTIEQQIDYWKGKEIISKEIDSVIVSVNFEEQVNSDYLFFAAFKNNSAEPVFITPENIFIEAFNDKFLYLTSPNGTNYALDPEDKILELNQRLRNREKQHETTTNLNTVLGLFTVVTDIALSPKENVVENVVNDIDYYATNQIVEDANFNNRISELESTKNYWQNEVIRKTDIYPAESIGGVFIIPVVKDAAYLKLHIIIGTNDFTYLFRQVRLN